MNAKQYINGIVQKIKCSGEKKKEIRKQLFTDINFRLEQGESLEDIISRMGSIKEIAEIGSPLVRFMWQRWNRESCIMLLVR